jgi:hypothetical protein
MEEPRHHPARRCRIASALGMSVEYLFTGFDTRKQRANPAIQDIVDELISFGYIELTYLQPLC